MNDLIPSHTCLPPHPPTHPHTHTHTHTQTHSSSWSPPFFFSLSLLYFSLNFLLSFIYSLILFIYFFFFLIRRHTRRAGGLPKLARSGARSYQWWDRDHRVELGQPVRQPVVVPNNLRPAAGLRIPWLLAARVPGARLLLVPGRPAALGPLVHQAAGAVAYLHRRRFPHFRRPGLSLFSFSVNIKKKKKKKSLRAWCVRAWGTWAQRSELDVLHL